MSLSNGFDTRASSLVGQIDAAIERVVAHFEDNDIALRADVLRALTAQAKLAFETERMRQRLRQHPLTRDLIDSISTQSTVFARLADGLAVQEFSCEYDAQRNVEILATVRWLLTDEGAQAMAAGSKHPKRSKKKQKTQPKVDRSVPLILRYAYSRRLVDEATTVVEFRVTSCVGDADTPKELVLFGMSSSSPYPRSFYEDVNGGGLSDDESDGGSEDEQEDDDDEVRPKAKRAAAAAAGDASDEDEAEGSADEADGDSEHGDDDNDDAGSDAPTADPHGEAVEAFNFEESAAESILAWLGEDGVDPADVFGFFLALPVAEDEWQLDERITEIVFSAASESEQEED